MTRLNKSTVSDIVASLLDEELLVESPEKRGMIGRNPRSLRVSHGRHFVGAISLNAPTSMIAIVDIDGTVAARGELKTATESPRDLIARCIAKLSELRASIGPHEFRGVGVTVAGIVDATQSRVVYSLNLQWKGVDVESIIHESLPNVDVVSVENDAKASALAELLLGSHALPSNELVFASFGVGIGVGTTVRGRILSGFSHAAGELGHMTIVEGGRTCVCGSKGCWEAYASDASIVQSYGNRKSLSPAQRTALTIADILRASAGGDDAASASLIEAAHYSGIGIANLIKAFDPEAVVVGGTPQRAWEIFRPLLVATIEKQSAFRYQPPTPILPSSLPDSPSLLGAAALVIGHVFTDYRLAV